MFVAISINLFLLYIRNNSIGNIGAIYIGNVLANLKQLKSLNLNL